jgi:hypothetical protein
MADAPIQCCSRQDVIDMMGGQERINEALDPDRTGTLNTGLLDKAIMMGSADVEAAVGERYTIWGASAFPYKIVRLAATLSRLYVWDLATGGRKIPEDVRTAATDARTELERIEKGQGSPGSPRPKSRLFPRNIDSSDCGRRPSYEVGRRSGLLGSR